MCFSHLHFFFYELPILFHASGVQMGDGAHSKRDPLCQGGQFCHWCYSGLLCMMMIKRRLACSWSYYHFKILYRQCPLSLITGAWVGCSYCLSHVLLSCLSYCFVWFLFVFFFLFFFLFVFWTWMLYCIYCDYLLPFCSCLLILFMVTCFVPFNFWRSSVNLYGRHLICFKNSHSPSFGHCFKLLPNWIGGLLDPFSNDWQGSSQMV